MTRKFFRGALMAAAVTAGAAVIAGCGDSSTATAPLTQDVTTTQVSGAANASAVKSSTSATPSESPKPSETSENPSETSEAKPSETKTEEPAESEAPPQDAQLTDKEKKYLAGLKKDGVSYNSEQSALVLGHYVCDSRSKNTDPATIKVYVTAGLGAMSTPGQAQSEDFYGGKADQLIANADRNLC